MKLRRGYGNSTGPDCSKLMRPKNLHEQHGNQPADRRELPGDSRSPIPSSAVEARSSGIPQTIASQVVSRAAARRDRQHGQAQKHCQPENDSASERAGPSRPRAGSLRAQSQRKSAPKNGSSASDFGKKNGQARELAARARRSTSSLSRECVRLTSKYQIGTTVSPRRARCGIK